MKIFISWSGDRSKALAAGLKDWLPTVLQYVQPWMSSSDINSGERWSSAIATQLQETNFGILCVTKENLEAPWLLFEAGALAKSMQEGRVIPLRLDVEPSEIKGPLEQFHSEKADADGVKKLITSLNSSWTTPLADDVLQKVFDPMWAELKRKIEAIPGSEMAHKKSRSQAEVLEDLVSNVRNMDIRLRDTLDEDPFMRRKFRRKMHPQMMMDLTHHIGARLSDPVRLLISASVYKDELPWLYELALEAYRSFIGGNPNEAMRALDQYRKAVDVLREGPFLDMLGMDGKMGYVMLRDALEYLPPMEDFDNDMVNDELKPTRTRKKAPF
jgi:TIR domain